MRHRLRERLHLLLGVIVATVLGVGCVIAAPAVADAPEFDRSLQTVTQSDVAELDVDVGDAESATLVLESSANEVTVEATIEDTDGDGSVPVRLDTTAIAPDANASFLTAADGGAVHGVTAEDLPRSWALPVGNYDLEVRSEVGESADVATLVVEPQIVIEGADDGEGLRLNATADQTVAGQAAVDPGEELQVRIESTGSNAYLVTERTTVREDHTFAASVDLSNVPADSEFELYVRHEGARKASADGRVLAGETGATVDDRGDWTGGPLTLEHEGERLELAAAPNRTVSGTADLPEGTELEIRLRSSDGSPFLRTDRTTVDGEGTFTAAFNMTDLEPGTQFTVGVRTVNEADHRTRAAGVVVAPDNSSTDSGPIDIDEGTDSGESSLVANAGLGAIGTIAVAAMLAVLGVVYMLGVSRR